MTATAFILGAGLGTRLRPLTAGLPKPLLPVGGRPLIGYAFDHCLTAGAQRFIVNTHHLAVAYKEAFPEGAWRGRPIVFHHEPQLLDTGGGLKNIEELLTDDEPLLVYNGDIICDIPLSRLIAAHRAAGREATLLLRSGGPVRNVALNATGRICDIRGLLGNPGTRNCQFTGIYLVERCFLRRLVPGKAESVIIPFVEMIREKPGAVASVVVDEGTWEDIGDPDAYRRVSSSVPRLFYEEDPGRKGFVGLLKLAGEENGPAAVPSAPSGSGLCEEEAFARLLTGVPAADPLTILPVGKGGSDRTYFRVASPSGLSSVLMRYGRMYEENDLYPEIAGFLQGIGVRTPEIFGVDPQKRLLLMEDLGDVDLFSLRTAPWEERRILYRRTLELAAKMHSFSLKMIPSGLRLMPGYDEKLYRWEQNYFLENLVQGFCRLAFTGEESALLAAELHALPSALLAAGNSLIHRDLQSQNVMVKDGMPVLIDFQGMRPGNPFYDLASLLFDPYVDFPAGGRDELLDFYRVFSGTTLSREAFRPPFFLAAAQRLMQALGAYGFLGLKRGKPHFLAHIPRGLENLSAAAGSAGSLPRLGELAERCLEECRRTPLVEDLVFKR